MGPQPASTTLLIDGHEVKITHPQRLLWPDDGLTKLDLVNYYVKIALYILPHIANRPLTLKPYASGIDGPFFYTHDAPKGTPDWVATTTFRPLTKRGKTIHPILADDTATLAWLANRAVIEIHPWLSRADQLASPDLVVFDLDPGQHATFALALAVAGRLRQRLAAVGLRSWAKTSGATGVHVYLPIERRYTFAQTRHFAEQLAQAMAADEPAHVTATLADPKLDEKVHIDYAQNSIGRTMAAVYSVRPRPRAPVSTPLTWDEVATGGFAPTDFTLTNIFAHLERVGDLFQPVAELQQRLPPDLL